MDSAVDEHEFTNTANQERPPAVHHVDNKLLRESTKQKEEIAVTHSGDEDTIVVEAWTFKKPTNGQDSETEQSLQTLDRLNAADVLVMNHPVGSVFNDEVADAITYLYANHLPLCDAFKRSKTKRKRYARSFGSAASIHSLCHPPVFESEEGFEFLEYGVCLNDADLTMAAGVVLMTLSLFNTLTLWLFMVKLSKFKTLLFGDAATGNEGSGPPQSDREIAKQPNALKLDVAAKTTTKKILDRSGSEQE